MLRSAARVVGLASGFLGAFFGVLMVASLVTGQGDYKYAAIMMLLHTIVSLELFSVAGRP